MSARLTIGIGDDFPQGLAVKLTTAGIRPVDAIEQMLTDALVKSIAECPLLKPHRTPTVDIHPNYNADRCVTLAHLAGVGYATWYVELKFATTTDNELPRLEVDPLGIELVPLNYGRESHAFRFTSKKLKKQTNHLLRLNQVKLPSTVFSSTLRALREMPALEQPYLANPRPGPRSNGFNHGLKGYEFVSFDHIATGDRHFCSCAKSAHEKMAAAAAAMAPGYATDGWPHQVVRLLSDVPYREGVCHLCVARTAGAETVGLLYGDTVQEFVAPYVDQLMLSESIDKATARTEVQQTLGLSRWIREAEMYSVVKKLFPEHTVVREASPKWLGRQRLDVFIPSLNLALEHQGQQHYRAVTAFGGEEALSRGVERDTIKRRLCEENGVELLEVRFDDAITASALRARLRRYLN